MAGYTPEHSGRVRHPDGRRRDAITPPQEHPMGKGNKTQKREVKKPKQDKKNPKPAKK